MKSYHHHHIRRLLLPIFKGHFFGITKKIPPQNFQISFCLNKSFLAISNYYREFFWDYQNSITVVFWRDVLGLSASPVFLFFGCFLLRFLFPFPVNMCGSWENGRREKERNPMFVLCAKLYKIGVEVLSLKLDCQSWAWIGNWAFCFYILWFCFRI